MAPKIAALYGALAGLLFFALTLGVFQARTRAQVMIGDGGDRTLLRASRAHANCAEYVPITLLLLALAEMTGAPALLLHAVGIALLVGRAIHAFGIRQEPEPVIFRMIGMGLTLAALSGAIAGAALGAFS